MNNEKNTMLWEIARKRASFKRHLFTYLVINAFFVALWMFSWWRNDMQIHFWPFWPIAGWGIGLVFHGLDAYGALGMMSSTEREYEKLKQQQEKNTTSLLNTP